MRPGTLLGRSSEADGAGGAADAGGRTLGFDLFGTSIAFSFGVRPCCTAACSPCEKISGVTLTCTSEEELTELISGAYVLVYIGRYT